jgi:hypothetical protein
VSELFALCYAAGALLLVLGGALKLVDPAGTVGALRALDVSVDDAKVRVLAAAEMVIGALALVAADRFVAACVAVSYAGFAVVIVVALVRGVPIDTCGCLGRLETPPGGRHLVVIAVALAGAVAELADPTASMLERLTEDGGAGVLFTVGALMLTGAAVALFRTGRRPSTLR